MNKLKLILAVMCIAFVGTSNAQSKLQQKLQAKLDKKMAAGKITTYDYTDESGMSGTYFVGEKIYKNHSTVGFKYAKEKGGEIVNQLEVDFGTTQGKRNTMTFTMKEKYKTKHDITYFYSTKVNVTNVSVNDHWRFVEIGDDVFAFVHDKDEVVMSVVAKDSSKLTDYDTETAQVLFDQQMAKINLEKMEKENAIWMKNALYAKNIGKVVFATEDYHMMKRGYGNKPPMVTGKDLKTVLDMAGNMQYMAFFKFPPAKQYPGQNINIEFEMAGQKTNRVECRSRSAAWGKMVPRIESSKFDDRQHSPRALRTYNQYHSQYVQDYAFIQLLYLNKDKFMIGQKYDLTIKMYTNRDGENGEIIAEGVVSLLYSPEAHLAFNGDPDKPEKKSIWTQFEEFLDE
jgi:hypothetical protein